MKKYRVEVKSDLSFAEWQSMNGIDKVDAETAEEAAKFASYTDGLENAYFRVYELEDNGFGVWEEKNPHNPEYFSF